MKLGPSNPVSPGAFVDQTAEQLAALSAKGSLPAYAELVRRFEDRLFNFLLRRMGSRVDAEDLTQESFIRAWQRIDRYDAQWRFSTWLFTIAARLAVSHHRKHSSSRPRQAPLDMDSPAPPGPAQAHEARADDRALGSRLWALAEETLNPDQHMALWLRYAEDLSIGEIATVMAKTEVGVRVCLFRARQSLAKALDQQDAAKPQPTVTLRRSSLPIPPRPAAPAQTIPPVTLPAPRIPGRVARGVR